MPTFSTTPSTLSPAADRIDSTSLHMQVNADVAALTGGQWAVTWATHAISATVPQEATLQLFGADGQAIGGPIAVEVGADAPQALALGDGSVLVAYTDRAGDGTGDIWAERYSASGQPLGGRVMLNAGEPYTQRLMELTPLSNGGFLAVWNSAQQENEGGSPGHGPGGQPTPLFVLTAQMFDAQGAKVGGPVALTPPTPQGSLPSVEAAPLAGGGFVIVKSVFDGTYRTTAQVYDAAGQPSGGEIVLATGTGSGLQGDTAVAGLADGGFVVARAAAAGDWDVVVQRYARDGTPVGAEHTLQSDRLEQNRPLVEALPDGGYIVAAQSTAEAASASGAVSHLYAQRFDAEGRPVGGPVQADAQGAVSAALAVGAQGTAALVWGVTADGGGYWNPDIQGRLITSSMVGAAAPNQGQRMVSDGPGDSLAGGALNDTLVAGPGGDVLTGGGGADRFVLSVEPWAPITIKDFELGVDRLDLRPVFEAAGYTGLSPDVGQRISFLDDGAGGTKVLFDRDGPGSGQPWPNYIARLEGVPVAQASWSVLSTGAPAVQGDLASGEPPPPGDGQVITSPGPGSTLTGGPGNDTLNASRGSDILTGGGGNDAFAWAAEPWSPATVKDFTLDADRLDLSKVFQAAGYAGADPIADGRIILLSQNADTLVLFDHDGPGGDWGNYIIKLEGVANSGLTWARLSGGGTTEPPPPPPPGDGQTITSPGPGSTLTGGAGADTLISSRGQDVLTGAAGADHFVFPAENWAPARITDFEDGVDKIDIRGMLDAIGYTGTDPFGAGYLKLIDDGAGGTKVLFDRDAAGGDPVWPNYVFQVEKIAPSALGPSDWIFQ